MKLTKEDLFKVSDRPASEAKRSWVSVPYLCAVLPTLWEKMDPAKESLSERKKHFTELLKWLAQQKHWTVEFNVSAPYLNNEGHKIAGRVFCKVVNDEGPGCYFDFASKVNADHVEKWKALMKEGHRVVVGCTAAEAPALQSKRLMESTFTQALASHRLGWVHLR